MQDELKFSPVQDVFVSGWSGDKNTNYSDDSHDYLTTTNTKNTDKKYTLIKFDIPALGAEVKEELSSELVLTYMEQTEPDGVDYYAYEYTGDWDESSATWNSISGDSYDKGDAIAEGVYDRENQANALRSPGGLYKEQFRQDRNSAYRLAGRSRSAHFLVLRANRATRTPRLR